MTPDEAFTQANRDGFTHAIKRQVRGINPNAYTSWLRGRPEYNHEAVLDLVQTGQDSYYDRQLARIIDVMSETPARLKTTSVIFGR